VLGLEMLEEDDNQDSGGDSEESDSVDFEDVRSPKTPENIQKSRPFSPGLTSRYQMSEIQAFFALQNSVLMDGWRIMKRRRKQAEDEEVKEIFKEEELNENTDSVYGKVNIDFLEKSIASLEKQIEAQEEKKRQGKVLYNLQ
jgi:hypothetical protein